MERSDLPSEGLSMTRKGKRLFAEGTVRGGLRLVDTKTSSTGVAAHTSEGAGKLEYGSFALEEESVG